MALLSAFSKTPAPLLKLPEGSFSVDREGNILVSTIPSTFPAELVNDIAQRVLTAFRGAAATQLPLSELIIHFPSLKITARELRGGAIVFLAPIAIYTENSHP